MTDFIAIPIPAAAVADARSKLRAGDPAVARVVADAKPAYPCRICLRDAEVGEAMLLFGYTPFDGEGPYVESGPILAHERACTPASLAPGDVPEVTSARAQCVVRAYDSRGWIKDGQLAETKDVATVIRSFFDDSNVAYAHVRNVGYGCFAYAVRRAGS